MFYLLHTVDTFQLGPPPSVPLEETPASQQTSSTPARPSSTLSTLKRERARERVRQQKEQKNSSDAECTDDSKAEMKDPEPKPTSPMNPPLKKTNYVEEPHSNASTLERKERKLEKEQALVRRITNDMQIAHYVRQMELADTHCKRHRGAFSTGVFRIRSLRFFEAGLRRALWYLGKAVANHKLLFVVLPLIFASVSLIGPLLHGRTITAKMPITVIGGPGNDVISNGFAVQRTQRDFNYSNPALARDTILRKDAVLAYSALKKRLDNYPAGKKEFLESCPAECELEKEMVDKIIRKSPQTSVKKNRWQQVALTYPETFVSMSKDSTNLSRVHLGSTIGGVETDSDGAISRAQALMLSFKLKDGITNQQMAAWTENFEDQVNVFTLPTEDGKQELADLGGIKGLDFPGHKTKPELSRMGERDVSPKCVVVLLVAVVLLVVGGALYSEDLSLARSFGNDSGTLLLFGEFRQ
uniref:ABC transporter domain-containing protein n=1 Tax=Angiostrongylus cantonensis TaxID=6313 RepID=A0A158P669_ANGCA